MGYDADMKNMENQHVYWSLATAASGATAMPLLVTDGWNSGLKVGELGALAMKVAIAVLVLLMAVACVALGAPARNL
jgi:hypothetical protein